MTINKETISRLTCQLIFSLSIIFTSSLCFAGIYKWVDEQGNTHYGQQRPKGAPVQKMDVQMHAPRDASSYKQPGQKDPDADPENPEDPDAKNKATDAEKNKEPPESAAAKKNRLAACAQARKKLTTMQNAGRVRSRDKDGNIKYLSEEQKSAQMKTTRDLIAKRCK